IDELLWNRGQLRRGRRPCFWFAWHTCSFGYMLCLEHKISDRLTVRLKVRPLKKLKAAAAA
ncbi:hypothetical protein, partial [Paraburkholderia sp. EG304]|uniref:hypothetical protein n=1 Tax=Paraburkholderia sp. EG304 TaxID=3237015 RepID=UPI0039783E96